jgi:hypothetical protein
MGKKKEMNNNKKRYKESFLWLFLAHFPSKWAVIFEICPLVGLFLDVMYVEGVNFA